MSVLLLFMLILFREVRHPINSVSINNNNFTFTTALDRMVSLSIIIEVIHIFLGSIKRYSKAKYEIK